MLVDVAWVGPVRKIQRVRQLPLAGEVLVNEGEQVQPTDVIAEASVPNHLFMVDIARGLGIDTADVKHCLVRQPGEYLTEGDVIAQIDGTFPRLVRLPVSGQFADFHRGQVVLEIGQHIFQVQAGLIGSVDAVIPEYGAVLSASGLLVQGMWGNGGVGSGKIKILTESWSVPLDPMMLAEVDLSILLAAGYCLSEDALESLGELEPAGLILCSMSPGLISLAATMPMPIIVLQGFGFDQPSTFFLETIRPHAGETACLQAGATGCRTGDRPEVIIPCEEVLGADPLSARAELCVGQRVAVFSGKWSGKVGQVVSLSEAPALFDNGLLSLAAGVQFENGQQVTVPQQNLVVLGWSQPMAE